MTRDTKEIITPLDKNKVIINTWITGREKRMLKRPFMEGMKVSIDDGRTIAEDVKPAEMIEKAENAAIEAVVVSINGNPEKIVEKILNMKGDDFDFIMSEINKVTNGGDFQKPEGKQKSGTE